MRVFLLAALGCCAAATAAPPPLTAQAGRITFDTFSLANGLRVITSEDHSTPVVAVDVWYNTGSRNERPGRSGFAHLFEHMMFQGSAHVKKAEHFQLVERAGGEENGSTQEDRTNYFEVLPSNRLNLALWLEADRMRSLAITQENFENQRETVKEERRLRVDNQPYARAFIDGLTLPFDSASCFAYAHSVIGDMADLNAATLPDVQAFFDTYYAPNNATLAVVGDFNPAELRRLITQYYAEHSESPGSAGGDLRLSAEPGPDATGVPRRARQPPGGDPPVPGPAARRRGHAGDRADEHHPGPGRKLPAQRGHRAPRQGGAGRRGGQPRDAPRARYDVRVRHRQSGNRHQSTSTACSPPRSTRSGRAASRPTS